MLESEDISPGTPFATLLLAFAYADREMKMHKRVWLAAVAAVVPGFWQVTAHAGITTYVGQDDGASTSGPWPLSSAAQTSFETAAAGYGSLSTITYEGLATGFYNITSYPGVTITITGTQFGNGYSGVSNVTAGNLYGFNVTPLGSEFLGTTNDTVTFTFSNPTHSFGTWMTGLQQYFSSTDGVEITFNDGTSELLEPPINVNGGAEYYGFTDTSAFTSVTITDTSPNFASTGEYDAWGIDDTTFNLAAVPEPASLALLAAALAGLAVGRGRRRAS